MEASMRKFLIAGAVVAGLAAAVQPAAAQVCHYDYYGRQWCTPGYGYGYGYPYRYGYREYDPGAAMALGVIGSIAGIMAHQAYRHHHVRRYHHRHR
jgi:hypothetical protein